MIFDQALERAQVSPEAPIDSDSLGGIKAQLSGYPDWHEDSDGKGLSNGDVSLHGLMAGIATGSNSGSERMEFYEPHLYLLKLIEAVEEKSPEDLSKFVKGFEAQ